MSPRRTPTGGVGSNQYQTRGRPKADAAGAVRWQRRQPEQRDITALAGQAVDDYHTLCASEGVDPEAELAEVTLRGLPTKAWIAARLTNAAAGERVDGRDPFDVYADAFGRIQDWPATAMALTIEHDDPRVPRDFACLATAAGREFAAALVADREHTDVRVALACGDQTPARLLVALAADPASEVRSEVGYNRQTPPQRLRALASDREVLVRQSVALNVRTPRRAINHLRKDPDWKTRLWAEQNQG